MTSKKSKAPREPLTDQELERLEPGDAWRLNLTDDEVARLRKINEARQKARQQEGEERNVRLRIEAEPLLADLRDMGFNVGNHWDINGKVEARPDIIPVLLKHLVRPYSDAIKRGLANALTIPHPAVRDGWSILEAEYRRAPEGLGLIVLGDTEPRQLGAKDGLANAVAAAVTEKNLPELIALVRDRSLGGSRVLLLSPLRRRRNKNPLVKQVLEELASDPELQREIASWR